MTEPLLLEDNRVYIGRCGKFKDVNHSQYVNLPPIVSNEAFFDALDKLRATDHGGFYSIEFLGRFIFDEEARETKGFDGFIEFTSRLKSRYQVKVLVAHRSLYGWLPSWYNQKCKNSQLFLQWPGVVLTKIDHRSQCYGIRQEAACHAVHSV